MMNTWHYFTTTLSFSTVLSCIFLLIVLMGRAVCNLCDLFCSVSQTAMDDFREHYGSDTGYCAL